MRPKSLALLLLALGCGLVASIGITQVMTGGTARRGASGETSRHLRGHHRHRDGRLLTPQVWKLEQWPKDKMPAGAISRTEDIEDRRTRDQTLCRRADPRKPALRQGRQPARRHRHDPHRLPRRARQGRSGQRRQQPDSAGRSRRRDDPSGRAIPTAAFQKPSREPSFKTSRCSPSTTYWISKRTRTEANRSPPRRFPCWSRPSRRPR